MRANSDHDLAALGEALGALAENRDLEGGIAVAQQVLSLLGDFGQPRVDEIIDDHRFKLQNSERHDPWFHPHPWMRGERSAFELLDSDLKPVQAKFYWLQKKTRQQIAGSVHFSPNWEDHDYTRTSAFKVGIDFFLTPSGESLLVVLSNRGNLRVVELHERLSATQRIIFSRWVELRDTSTAEQIHGGLWDSFKIQSVNETFYEGVSDSFNDLLQHLIRLGRDREEAKLFASRLLGRIIFIWFLRKMGIVDQQAGYFEPQGQDATTYYRNKLERLFFETLNRPVGDRNPLKVDSGDIHLDLTTPYLNGGLFAPQDGDWFLDENLTFPIGYFERLFAHFEKFNFTTDESSPEYEQVAIDPEMLGRVFESLLASQLSESGDSARRAKGAYYTPREIVAYMARESLREYLLKATQGHPKAISAVTKLLDTTDQDWAIAKSNSLRDIPADLRPLLLEALDTLQAIDPACGSGAFPMGLLQLLYKTYARLDPRFDPYKTKLQIIQNNIFGVDIEPMAVEISRLRAWLSLVVEENSTSVEPLPNLDFKFICANSLVPLHEGMQSLFSDGSLLERLETLRLEYFSARTPEEKIGLQSKFLALGEDGSEAHLDDERTQQLRSFNPFNDKVPASFFDAESMFGVVDGFDIVLGNPPYIGLKGHKQTFDVIRDTSLGRRFYTGKMDYFYFFFHLGLDLLKDGGTLAYITTNYFITATFGKKLIEDIRLRSSVLEMINFNEMRIFESAAGQHNMVTILRRGYRPEVEARTTMATNKLAGSADKSTLVRILNREDPSAVYASVSQKDLYQGNKILMSRSGSGTLEHILDLMADSPETLDKVANVRQGIISGADKVSSGHVMKYGAPEGQVGEGIFVLTSEEVEALHLDEHELKIVRPHFKNSDIYRYGAKLSPDEFIIFADKNLASLESRPQIMAHLNKYRTIIDATSVNSPYLHRPRAVTYEGEKIMVSKRAPENRFGYSLGPWYGSSDINFIESKVQYLSNKMLLGILNSSFYFAWFYTRGKKKGELLELFQVPLAEAPIPAYSDLKNSLFLELERLVTELVESNRGEYAGPNVQIDHEIDVLVGQLFGVSPEETDEVRAWAANHRPVTVSE